MVGWVNCVCVGCPCLSLDPVGERLFALRNAQHPSRLALSQETGNWVCLAGAQPSPRQRLGLLSHLPSISCCCRCTHERRFAQARQERFWLAFIVALFGLVSEKAPFVLCKRGVREHLAPSLLPIHGLIGALLCSLCPGLCVPRLGDHSVPGRYFCQKEYWISRPMRSVHPKDYWPP